ncbi:hypothetical protein K0M31_012119 [Melipona bicolor]|uniref:Uncharacterized protein n=1 Tax=Melipona bicolor TaxID=60889 RepID=A0AA40GB55_9HYME|nr:hypothetical protein K0M31_012119 [Melipona bicolor]
MEWKRKSGKKNARRKVGGAYAWPSTLVWDNMSLNRESSRAACTCPSRKKHLTAATTQGGFSTVGNIAAHSDFEGSPRLEALFDR